MLVAASAVAAAPPDESAAFVAQGRQAGLRICTGERVILITDRPARAGDGVAELPAVFDAAFAAWCDHYGIDPGTLPGWRAEGCLVSDRERFRAAGLLPDADFRQGFCAGRRFWLMDQSSPAYRRHLFLHEGVHAFTLTVRGLDAPQWYREGIAEYLATHRLVPTADTSVGFVPTPVPAEPDQVEQLGRIESLQALVAADRQPTLAAVFAAPLTAHDDLAAYAANWAAVALFARHPAHARGFALAEQGPLDHEFNRLLATTPGWQPDRAARDFAAFITEIDYGWDFDRLAVDWAPGRPAENTETCGVRAGRGWQNTGLSLAAGSRWTLSASGRVGVGEVSDTRTRQTTPLESTADGIALRWYRGRPVGRLLAAQWVEPGNRGSGRFTVIGESAAATCTAVVAGPLFLKINEAPARLASGRGTFAVRLSAAPP